MGGAAQAPVEALRFRLRHSLHHVDLQQAVANQERARDPGLDRLLVPAAHDEAIDDGVDHGAGDR